MSDTPDTALSLWRGRINCRRTSSEALLLHIAQEVASRFEAVTAEDIRGRVNGGTNEFGAARREFCATAYATGRLSLPTIGKFMGGRDHSCVHRYIRQYQERHREELAVAA